MQVCTSHQTDNHASTPLLSFLQAGCPSCHPTNSVKALKAVTHHCDQCRLNNNNNSWNLFVCGLSQISRWNSSHQSQQGGRQSKREHWQSVSQLSRAAACCDAAYNEPEVPQHSQPESWPLQRRGCEPTGFQPMIMLQLMLSHLHVQLPIEPCAGCAAEFGDLTLLLAS